MEKVIVNRPATILKGELVGVRGTVTEYDIETDKVSIQLDSLTTVIVSSDNVKQEPWYILKDCDCGCMYSLKETDDDGQNYCHVCGRYY